jgi:hypothetical protein
MNDAHPNSAALLEKLIAFDTTIGSLVRISGFSADA